MAKLICIISFVVCLTNLSYGDVQINDPNNILNQVDTFLAISDFDQSFKVGDLARFEKKNCKFIQNSDGTVTADCEGSQIIEDAVIEKTDQYAKTSSGEIIARDNFTAFYGNYLRKYLGGLSDADENITEVTVDMETLSHGSVIISSVNIQTVIIDFTTRICKQYVPAPVPIPIDGMTKCFRMPARVVLGKGLPFIAQLVENYFVRDIVGVGATKVLKGFSYDNKRIEK